MKVILHEREMELGLLQHEIKLMSQERVLSQIIGDQIGWFRHYQPVDVRILETILGQTRDQYESLPDNEKKWLDNLKEFYDDFKSFEWEKYRSLSPQEKKRHRLETAFSWAEKLRPLIVINEEFDDPAYFLQLMLMTEERTLTRNGISIPRILIDPNYIPYLH